MYDLIINLTEISNNIIPIILDAKQWSQPLPILSVNVSLRLKGKLLLAEENDDPIR